INVLILGRLAFYHRNLLENAPAELASHYLSLAVMIIESAALYSMFALLFLTTYALN
ncbi:hypothetical protein C8J57DRAFT_1040179, partial [Mycena rebaudengoi]